MEEAKSLDTKFETFTSEFAVPTFKTLGIKPPKGHSSDDKLTYLCGNSLGLMPLQTRRAINDELDAWSARAVESHFNHPGKDVGLTPWMDIDLPVVPLLAPVVGAKETECAIMGSLTANLNALMVAFYKPSGQRRKILFEKGSFPSDYYAIYNQIRLKDGNPDEDMIQLEPRQGEYTLRTEDILKAIEDNKDTLALCMLPGIQYYTGQLFEIKTITEFAHKYDGIVVGWDLAHAVGNVPLKLHDWGVDFAVWCSYKYLNAGPGAISGIFVHEKHGEHVDGGDHMARLAGWWGNNAAKRFQMLENFEPISGALGFRQSNPSVIDVVAVKSSLQLFKKFGGVDKLREKSLELTGFLEKLLKSSKYYVAPGGKTEGSCFTILTPEDPLQRGAQLSLLFFPSTSKSHPGIMEQVFDSLRSKGVLGDERRPDVIRLAPVPMYNTFTDCVICAEALEQAMAGCENA
ncbi:CYFA0S15e01178g1_1 [Cyberlindnera fabianii]|uniref:Kynureninase n=1 Tax=Cyberlindnera fabianii TaxID=36022 RepID=A0A061B5B1_CYBFA|nr:CYFA0S15e01178g1_1 [Cyberlindnera fabianii]